VKTPGTCRSLDAEQDIVRAIHDDESLVFLDAVTFGGHSYTVKRAQDRLICLLTPFFEKRSELTHHGSRYDTMASLHALGWLPAPHAGQFLTWQALADANAVNMLAPRVGAVVVDDTRPAAWPEAIRGMLLSTDVPGSNIHARGPLREAGVEHRVRRVHAIKEQRVNMRHHIQGGSKPVQHRHAARFPVGKSVFPRALPVPLLDGVPSKRKVHFRERAGYINRGIWGRSVTLSPPQGGAHRLHAVQNPACARDCQVLTRQIRTAIVPGADVHKGSRPVKIGNLKIETKLIAG
jgi:hypothetical protein